MFNPVFKKLKGKGLPPPTGLPDLNLSLGFVVKDWFFDRDNVKKHLSDFERSILRRAGAYTRKVARSSMKNRPPTRRHLVKDYASAPGQPPHAHAMAGSEGGLKYGPSNIVYGYEPHRHAVVIGPRKKSGRDDYVPFKLEYGSQLTNIKNPRRRDRKIGDTGAIRYGDPRPGSEGKRGLKKIRAVNGHYYDVRFAKIKTAEQLRRVEDVETFLWGPKMIGSISLAPRPYMRPALAAATRMLPRFWWQAYRSSKVRFSGV